MDSMFLAAPFLYPVPLPTCYHPTTESQGEGFLCRVPAPLSVQGPRPRSPSVQPPHNMFKLVQIGAHRTLCSKSSY